MYSQIFNEFAMLLVLSVVVGMITSRLRQPLLLSYLLVGVIAGPSMLGWISSSNELEILASFGVTLLLFIVGLKLDLNQIKVFGRIVLIIGIGQIVLTTLAGFGIASLLGLTFQHALYTAIALTFSSTIIIVKVLSDRYEIDSLYGRISVGILVIQDIVAVLLIIVMSSLNIKNHASVDLTQQITTLILKGIGFLAVIRILMSILIPPLIQQCAKSQELLVLFALAWAVLLAVIGDSLGFGKEVGGFLAGVALASTRYREAIASRLESVRNILLLFFFLNLGASLHLAALSADIVPALVLSLFVLSVKPLIVIVLTSLMRFRLRTGFLAGATMAQISEFSFILAALALQLGYIDEKIQDLITFVGLVSIISSTYMMVYANKIYHFALPLLKRFQKNTACREDEIHVNQLENADVIIYGVGRHGGHIANVLEKKGFKVIGVDFDPRKVNPESHRGRRICYGDAEDIDFLKALPLAGVHWVVSTIPQRDANRTLVSSLRERNYDGRVALSAYHESDIEYMKALNVDLIIVPYKDAAASAAEKLAELMKKQEPG